MWNYDPTAEEYYYGFDRTLVSTGPEIPIAAEFTQVKQADQEMAMRVTREALAVDTPIWTFGDSAYDILDWHDHLLAAGVVLVTPYNPRNTDDPLDIEYRVEDRIEEHSKDVRLKQSILDETHNHRTEVERTNDAIKDCGLGHVRAHARTEGFPCTVSPTRRCNHRLQAERRPWPREAQAMRWFLRQALIQLSRRCEATES